MLIRELLGVLKAKFEYLLNYEIFIMAMAPYMVNMLNSSIEFL